MTHVMVVGTSEPQDFALTDDGAAIDGTGITIALDWRGSDPVGPPAIAWLEEEDGTVRVTSTAGMSVGTYRFRFKLTDGEGAISYIPNLTVDANVWRVTEV